MGRTSTARERLLDAACDLLRTRGYADVGVAEICARADVRKGSFYHFFESKQALTLEVVDAHWHRQRADWLATLRAPDRPALARLEELFRSLTGIQRATQEEHGAVSGCLLANLALELPAQEQPVRDRLAAVFAEEVDLVQAALAEAAAEGTVRAGAADRDTARAAVAQMEGMVLFAKVTDDPAVLDGLWPQVSRLFGVRGN
ncbi:TetR/AcrR family transcriptional regulator [Kitasatospora hibisci]|uniref:TetR/AcrR family transcriptional regulator n=1 Tax=Kitasatospora hibisci TaxID=3369522 RepID=UPI003755208C